MPTELPNAKPVLVASAALQRRDLDGALPNLVGAAQSAASVIRDRFSPDAWRALTDLSELIKRADRPGAARKPRSSSGSTRALRIIASFSGLAQENMSQLAGWRFLELGRRIERAIATCRFVRQFAFATELDSALDVLLELADSQITYRLRYVMVAAPRAGHRPRGARSQQSALGRLPVGPHRSASGGAAASAATTAGLSPPEQIATALATQIRTADAATLDEATIPRPGSGR